MLDMMKKLTIAAVLFTGMTAPAFAQTYWLNIPGSFSAEEQRYLPSISLPTGNHNDCSEAIVQYAKDNLVHYVGCDVRPLPDAVNLRHAVR